MENVEKPKKCGECERFWVDDNGESWCIPLKEKYGWTPVKYNSVPWEECPFEFSRCDMHNHPIFGGFCSKCKAMGIY